MQMLKSRLYELELRKRQAEKDKIEAGKSKIEWGSQIRSYVLDDRWVKDLRSGYKVHNPDAVDIRWRSGQFPESLPDVGTQPNRND